jgi:hypothetical protein
MKRQQNPTAGIPTTPDPIQLGTLLWAAAIAAILGGLIVFAAIIDEDPADTKKTEEPTKN